MNDTDVIDSADKYMLVQKPCQSLAKIIQHDGTQCIYWQPNHLPTQTQEIPNFTPYDSWKEPFLSGTIQCLTDCLASPMPTYGQWRPINAPNVRG
eukprot:scaffold90079_cov27-Prasinocladus_malaysianus.AAC.1